ncbi:DegV family protein, partial [Falsarthrobacter nasiphocae]
MAVIADSTAEVELLGGPAAGPTSGPASAEPRLARADAYVSVPVLIDGEPLRASGAKAAAEMAMAHATGRAVTTARPAPQAFADAIARCVEAGAASVVVVTMSARLSGTWESARLGAEGAAVPVTVVDSGSIGWQTAELVDTLVRCRPAEGGPSGAEDVRAVAGVHAETARPRLPLFATMPSVKTLLAGGRGAGHAAAGGAAQETAAGPAPEPSPLAAAGPWPVVTFDDGRLTGVLPVGTRDAAVEECVRLAAASAQGSVRLCVETNDPTRAALVEEACASAGVAPPLLCHLSPVLSA